MSPNKCTIQVEHSDTKNERGQRLAAIKVSNEDGKGAWIPIEPKDVKALQNLLFKFNHSIQLTLT